MAPSPLTNGTSKPSLSSPRVALVTGAAQGMGRTIAERLFKDGYHVALNDISIKQHVLEEVAEGLVGASSLPTHENGNGHHGRLGGGGKHTCTTSSTSNRVMVVAADVSVEEEVKGMVEKVVEEFGGLDVMVANAGIAIIKPFEDTTTEMFDQVLSVNVRGTFLCYKYGSQQMIKQGRGGRIIGASSLAGKRGQGNLCAYSASKFAIRGLTQSAAVEFGKHGITVNAYAPGGVVTEMFESMPTKMKESLVARASLGTLGATEDIASLVSFIVSDEARFITGQTITIDGGIHFD